jgi:hypothetical protein
MFKPKWDEDDVVDWFNTIKKHIDHSDGEKEQKTAEGLVEPWKFDSISNK